MLDITEMLEPVGRPKVLQTLPRTSSLRKLFIRALAIQKVTLLIVVGRVGCRRVVALRAPPF